MKKVSLSVRRHLGMCISRLIYDYKPFNRNRMVRFYSAFIKPGDLCFDIGAHTGNRSGTWLSALSFEIFPTTPRRTIACIIKLEQPGRYEYNWSLTESFRLNSPSWLNSTDMIKTIKAYTGRKSGDVYARLHTR